MRQQPVQKPQQAQAGSQLADGEGSKGKGSAGARTGRWLLTARATGARGTGAEGGCGKGSTDLFLFRVQLLPPLSDSPHCRDNVQLQVKTPPPLQSTTQPLLCSHLQFMNSAPPPAHPPRGKSLSAASPWLLSPRRFPVTLGVHKQLGSMTQTKGQLSLSTLGHLSSLGSALLPCPGSISNT